MESIFSTLAKSVAALFATVIAMFGGSPQAPLPQEIAPIAEEVAEVALAAEAEATTEKTAVSVAPSQDPVLEAYKLGISVGQAQGAIEVIEKQAVKEEKERERVRNLPEDDNDDEDMNEDENAGAGEPEALGSIKLSSPFKEQGMGRTYKAVTDPNVERWDQAAPENFVVIGIEVFDANGSPIRKANVTVTASDGSQSRELGGKDNYQYLFREPGEHTLTFSADGAEDEVVELTAE